MSAEEFQFRSTASLQALRRRSQLLREIRAFFEDRDFMHVETPLISRDTVVDRHIEPVEISASKITGASSQSDPMFLQTSPEFAMKRLLASGATAIYQICKAFRKGESGRFHNPEFTMLEWYRVGDDCQAGIGLLADFAQHVFAVPAVDTMTYQEAFVKLADVDPLSASVKDLKAICQARGIDASAFAEDQDRDSWLNLVMSEVIEPGLGSKAPVIVSHWPASQAALAKVVTDDHGQQVAERFELFYRGVELANGYHELLDPDELESRNEKVNRQRAADGNQSLRSESRLLQAMQHGLPACSGVAVGVDRLLIVLLGLDSIDQAIAFPFDRA